MKSQLCATAKDPQSVKYCSAITDITLSVCPFVFAAPPHCRPMTFVDYFHLIFCHCCKCRTV